MDENYTETINYTLKKGFICMDGLPLEEAEIKELKDRGFKFSSEYEVVALKLPCIEDVMQKIMDKYQYPYYWGYKNRRL